MFSNGNRGVSTPLLMKPNPVEIEKSYSFKNASNSIRSPESNWSVGRESGTSYRFYFTAFAAVLKKRPGIQGWGPDHVVTIVPEACGVRCCAPFILYRFRPGQQGRSARS